MKYFDIKLSTVIETSMNDAHFECYFLDSSSEMINSGKHPLVIVCPGGGYRFTSDREAEPIAMKFLANGINCIVLRYSISPVRYPVQIEELAYTVLFAKEHCEEYNIDPDKIYVQGSSAGGHLAANYGIEWDKSFLKKFFNVEVQLLKINGLILSYPVISSKKYDHRDSMLNLCGENIDVLRDRISIEENIDSNFPQAFIWHTFSDNCVPVENSLMLAEAMRKKNIKFELHIFPDGAHGLSLANKITEGENNNTIQVECQEWIDMAIRWILNK